MRWGILHAWGKDNEIWEMWEDMHGQGGMGKGIDSNPELAHTCS